MSDLRRIYSLEITFYCNQSCDFSNRQQVPEREPHVTRLAMKSVPPLVHHIWKSNLRANLAVWHKWPLKTELVSTQRLSFFTKVLIVIDRTSSGRILLYVTASQLTSSTSMLMLLRSRASEGLHWSSWPSSGTTRFMYEAMTLAYTRYVRPACHYWTISKRSYQHSKRTSPP